MTNRSSLSTAGPVLLGRMIGGVLLREVLAADGAEDPRGRLSVRCCPAGGEAGGTASNGFTVVSKGLKFSRLTKSGVDPAGAVVPGVGNGEFCGWEVLRLGFGGGFRGPTGLTSKSNRFKVLGGAFRPAPASGFILEVVRLGIAGGGLLGGEERVGAYAGVGPGHWNLCRAGNDGTMHPLPSISVSMRILLIISLRSRTTFLFCLPFSPVARAAALTAAAHGSP
mmetsp:Transcript_2292/g.4392  ORF Transcript_2292/g.4392 Transcript_2292/m.4392 type:complete len:224 (+) Transcript_2292:779-1450(+)